MTLILLKNIDQLFCKMPLNLDWSDGFLMVRLRLCILGRNDTENYALVSLSYQGYVISICFITSAANFDHMVKMVNARFLTVKLLFLFL